jgi:hypothetical protein
MRCMQHTCLQQAVQFDRSCSKMTLVSHAGLGFEYVRWTLVFQEALVVMIGGGRACAFIGTHASMHCALRRYAEGIKCSASVISMQGSTAHACSGVLHGGASACRSETFACSHLKGVWCDQDYPR